ncbi:Rad52/Rad22 family DNA repair protein [Pseudorhodoplanes sp.]|uniref:Rad52/Rad22 family DNA repair protein n=1 Tax=Pseudorhodoplanes sp. TaxID=1934341 RepID=UPI00391A34D5
MTGFSARQTRALGKNIKDSFIRVRQLADGRELTYIEGWYAISEANRIFGFDGWNRETIESRCVTAREARGVFTAVYVTKVRVSVQADQRCVVREAYGTGEGVADSLSEAHEKAIKTSETDATKRALATFGKPFGLALYADNKRSAARTAGIPNHARRRTRQERGANGRYSVVPQPWPNPSHATTLLANEARIELQSTSGVEDYAQTEATTTTAIDAPVGLQPPDQERGPEERNAEDGTVGLMIPREVRRRNAAHLRRVANEPCLICSRTPSDAHHLQFTQPRAMSRKVSDEYTVPLCRIHHRQLHQSGNEIAWWIDMEIDPLPIAKELWRNSILGENAGSAADVSDAVARVMETKGGNEG